MDTKITRLLGIKYPVIQGGMAWISEGGLTAAVSNAGGLGIIASGNAPTDYLRQEVKKAKSLTDKPIGLNLLMLSPYAKELATMIVEEGVCVVTTGAGTPKNYIKMWQDNGIKVVPVIPNVEIAKKMQDLGADAIIAEGTESGGHIGDIGSIALLPQVSDAVDIPIIAAGGVGDSRGVIATMALGASGVQCGTIFLTAKECMVHKNYKDLVINAKETSTKVTGRTHGHPVRALENELTKKYIEMENDNVPFEELEEITLGSLRKACVEGSLGGGTFMCGQIAGLVKNEDTAENIIKNLFNGVNDVLKSLEEKVK